MPPLCEITATCPRVRSARGSSGTSPASIAGLKVGQSEAAVLAKPSPFGPLTAMSYFSRDRLHFPLQRRPGLALLLGEAGRENDRRLDAGLAAVLQLLRHELRRDDHRGEIGRRQLGDRLVGLEPLHLRLAAAHRIDRARVRMAAHDLHDAAAQAARIRRRADDRDRLRPQQLLRCQAFSAGPARAR